MVRGETTGDVNDPEGLGLALAEELLAQGAGDLLAAIRPAAVNEGSA
jgi:NAD(P)-dependent dehydrogenase (short-subunit alcohol dehydrogenase family)